MKKAIERFGKNHHVIVRTISAGVWCGLLMEREGEEVVLYNARRMWQWRCKKSSISLSGVVAYGIRQDESKILPAVPSVWLKAIKIMPISGEPLASIMDAPEAAVQAS